MPRKSIYHVSHDSSGPALSIAPNSLESEQAVIGGVFRDGRLFPKVAGLLAPEDFYSDRHRAIFRAFVTLSERGSPLDLVTVSEHLERVGDLDTSGGLVYLGEVAGVVSSVANLEHYAKIVRESSVLRQLIKVGERIIDSAYRPGDRPVLELVDAAEQQIFRIAERNAQSLHGFETIQDLVRATIDRLTRLHATGEKIVGLPSGFSDLDALTSGFQQADLVIVAARPSMGKTAFALGLAEYVAVKVKTPVAIFSLEMTGEQLVMRLFASLARLDYQQVRTGQLFDEDWPRLTNAIDALVESQMFIDATPALTPVDLRARARRLAREHGPLGMVVVDYRQLMRVPEIRNNRVAEVSEISRSLKALAKELGCPVIALSQLNRGLEQRVNKRPVLSDLRDSGAIEQDADTVLFLYRDEVYDDQSPDKGIAEVIIGKQRTGPIGKIRLVFLGAQIRFSGIAYNA